MIEILINYMPDKDCFGVYEPSTDTLLVSSSISESLVSLSKFLKDSGMIETDIVNSDDIIYHLDSKTMRGIIENNMNLMKRLSQAPSGFMISSQRFGTSLNSSSSSSNTMPEKGKNDFGKTKKFGNSSFGGKKSGGFSGNSSFKTSFKKFGGQENF